MNNLTTIPEEFIQSLFFLVEKYWILFLNGLYITLLIALVGTLFGLIIGLGVAALRQIKPQSRDNFFQRFSKRTVQILCLIYIQYLRGTPMLVQGLIVYYGLNGMGIKIPALVTGILVVSINTSAYMAEILRAGIQSIDKGQMEAARSIGMTYGQAMRYFILPQALKNAIPAIGNEVVVNIKDSCVLNYIGVMELFYQATRIGGMHYRYIEPLFVISLIYLVLTITSASILNVIERKLDKPSRTYPSSQTSEVLFETLKPGKNK